MTKTLSKISLPFISSYFFFLGCQDPDGPPQALGILSGSCEILNPWDTQDQVNQVGPGGSGGRLVAAMTGAASFGYRYQDCGVLQV